MSIEMILNLQATVKRKTVTYSDSGDPSTSWENVETGVVCAVESAGGRLYQRPGGLVQAAQYRAFFPADTDIQAEDQVVIGSETYIVAHVTDAAGRGHHLEVALVQP